PGAMVFRSIARKESTWAPFPRPVRFRTSPSRAPTRRRSISWGAVPRGRLRRLRRGTWGGQSRKHADRSQSALATLSSTRKDRPLVPRVSCEAVGRLALGVRPDRKDWRLAMFSPWTSALVALVLVVTSPAASYADGGLLRTIHALDEARGYCLDVAGPPENLRLDDPLQAHTCKYGAPLDDQRF